MKSDDLSEKVLDAAAICSLIEDLDGILKEESLSKGFSQVLDFFVDGGHPDIEEWSSVFHYFSFEDIRDVSDLEGLSVVDKVSEDFEVSGQGLLGSELGDSLFA